MWLVSLWNNTLCTSLLVFWCTSSNAFSISTVTTLQDWYALADVRYDEWIMMDDDGVTTTTSRRAFRRATVDIYKEERPHATLFLAKHAHDGTVMGAAELSPHELEDCCSCRSSIAVQNHISSSSSRTILYVTDVVTNRQYRRQGVAATLMQALELHAREQQQEQLHHQQHQEAAKIYLVLHVAPDNSAALQFYQTLGYKKVQDPSSNDGDDNDGDDNNSLLTILNVTQLAENSGTQGQLLLSKTIS
jgi:ribosomal protein S18 acetylase RimI-like enzyme